MYTKSGYGAFPRASSWLMSRYRNSFRPVDPTYPTCNPTPDANCRCTLTLKFCTYGVRNFWLTVKMSFAAKFVNTGGAQRVEPGIVMLAPPHGPATVVIAAVPLNWMSLYAGPGLKVLNGSCPTKKSC